MEPGIPLRRRANYVVFMTIYGMVKYLPHPLGDPLRWLVLRIFARRFGRCFWIKDGVSIIFPENLEVGDCCSFNEGVVLDCDGGLTIGSGVRIAHHTAIHTADHGVGDPVRTVSDQPKVRARVTIHDNVWIGCHVIILKGVTIGQGAVLGAGAVITRDVPPYAIMAGNPARQIKSRRTDSTEESRPE